MFGFKSLEIPIKEDCLPGRTQAVYNPENHFVTGAPMSECMSQDSPRILFGMGCFWGAEKMFWDLGCVKVTGVGYAAGHTPNPTYEEVCSGLTAHSEIVFVTYDDASNLEELLKVFWEDTILPNSCVKVAMLARNTVLGSIFLIKLKKNWLSKPKKFIKQN
jgi:peptide-methionine (S)-S-oxide reductase